jgi:hypothetical protein
LGLAPPPSQTGPAVNIVTARVPLLLFPTGPPQQLYACIVRVSAARQTLLRHSRRVLVGLYPPLSLATPTHTHSSPFPSLCGKKPTASPSFNFSPKRGNSSPPPLQHFRSLPHFPLVLFVRPQVWSPPENGRSKLRRRRHLPLRWELAMDHFPSN